MLINTFNVTEVFSYLLTYYPTFIAIHYQYLLVYYHVYIQQLGYTDMILSLGILYTVHHVFYYINSINAFCFRRTILMNLMYHSEFLSAASVYCSNEEQYFFEQIFPRPILRYIEHIITKFQNLQIFSQFVLEKFVSFNNIMV